MQDLPYDKPGRFYKGNLHTHSTRSDGTKPPEEVVRLYRERGYSFVAITDHFLPSYGYPITDTTAFRTDGFTTLLGAELHGPRTAVGDLWHIVAVGLPADFERPSPNETGPEIAARASDAGAFIGMAHPAWYALTLADAETLTCANAVEVYNTTCSKLNDRGDSWHLCDVMLSRGHRINAYAADDAHFVAGRPDSFEAWVQVRAESADPDSLLAALKAGQYYSSQGPEIHDISVRNGSIVVRCSEARAVYAAGRGSVARSVASDDGLTEYSFPLAPFQGSYCRITVLDAEGRRAWSNPIWLT